MAFSAAAQPALLGHVPAVVQTTYAARFSGVAPTPTWTRRPGGRWEAAYRQTDGRAAVATFNGGGQWLRTSTVESAKELPAPARAYVLAQKPKKPVRRVARITSADGSITWQARVNGTPLLFDHTGHLLRAGEAKRVAGTRRSKRGTVLPAAPVVEPVVSGAAVQ